MKVICLYNTHSDEFIVRGNNNEWLAEKTPTFLTSFGMGMLLIKVNPIPNVSYDDILVVECLEGSSKNLDWDNAWILSELINEKFK